VTSVVVLGMARYRVREVSGKPVTETRVGTRTRDNVPAHSCVTCGQVGSPTAGLHNALV